ncbi:hypothetical protein OG413_44410 [Streptomyces sp. NBC_01433]|uniref:hypothetical protein n=1 Tax=Streptomyces sp. NBC_01433 TaxID=2903864 RepID=UPI00224E609B|nr:hypothetical protein [Streptomyces sp. NBC_01433]MCX4682228.1 hypothetical protein [Streptomyces sp. NBC_01433]
MEPKVPLMGNCMNAHTPSLVRVPYLAAACQDLPMFSLGRDGMRDLQARAENLSADVAGGRWKPNRFEKRALRKLSGEDGPVIHREAIVTMFNELYVERGPRQINKMTGRLTGRLTTLLMDTAAAQDQPSIAVLSDGQEALGAVRSLVGSTA